MNIYELFEKVMLGSSKSGHYGHKGIPGHQGGSAAGGVVAGVDFGRLDIEYEMRGMNDNAREIKKKANELFDRGHWERKDFNAVSGYTLKEFRTINSDLRADELSSLTKRRVKVIDKLFESAPPLKEDLYVYRGRPHPGTGDIHDKAYVSTSMSAQAAASFGAGDWGERDYNKVIRIKIPSGSKVVYAGGITQNEEKQFEVLLPRNTMLKNIGGSEYEYAG